MVPASELEEPVDWGFLRLQQNTWGSLPHTREDNPRSPVLQASVAMFFLKHINLCISFDFSGSSLRVCMEKNNPCLR